MTSWVKVGAKCVCRNAVEMPHLFVPGGDPNDTLDGLTEGVIYTVYFARIHPMLGILVIALEEIDRGPCPDGYPEGFAAERFSPIVDERDDIAAFLAIANKGKLDVMAEMLDEAWRVSERVN